MDRMRRQNSGSTALLAATILAGAVLAASAFPNPPEKPASVDFAHDVLPALKASCFQCHGPDRHEGGLRLDSRAIALKGGTSGAALLPGKSAKSLLLTRILGTDGKPRMPMGFAPLSPDQVKTLRAWIDQGAAWPDTAKRTHWAYVKPVPPPLPKVKSAGWARNPVDLFVLARLEKAGLKPSPEAPKEILIRRLSLDLIGLPPSVKEVDAFLADKSPDAYEKLVDRLLASPHFGERWARPWLDLARYADTHGYEKDDRRSIWPYRDWVINALNKNMPYDQFTIEQIAGDLLPNATNEQKVATGFHRNTMKNEEGGVDQEEARWLTNVDRVNTTGEVWLGTTLGCAQCHNHKYDPFTTQDYYRFLAFFEHTTEPALELLTPEQAEKRKSLQTQIAAQEQTVKAAGTDKPALDAANAKLAALKKELAEVKAPSTLIMQEKPDIEAPSTFVRIKGGFLAKGEKVTAAMPSILTTGKSDKPLNRLDLARWLVSPENPLTARVAVNRMWETVFGRGIVETSEDFGTQGQPPTHPELLDYLATQFAGVQSSTAAHAKTQRREEGQEQTTTETQRHRGIYLSLTETGRQGSKGAKNQTQAAARSFPPYQGGTEGGAVPVAVAAASARTPEHLNTEHRPWDVKSLVRLIVMSATYRQSSRVSPALLEKDPQNRLLARGPRFRMEAETLRDQALEAAGLLSHKIGGPSVFPDQPEGIWNIPYNGDQWKLSPGEDRFRRGLYTFWRRTSPYPAFMTFDATSRESCTVRRIRTNTPLQALTMLNDPAYLEAAKALAARMTKEGGTDAASRIAYGFRLCVARKPKPAELTRLTALYEQQVKRFRPDAKAAVAVCGKVPDGADPSEAAALTIVGNVLLNLDETLTKE